MATNKIWVYSITFYTVDDEYCHKDWCGTYTKVFPSKDAAERFKKDWEEPKNLKALERTRFDGVNLYDWRYTGDSFESSVTEEEILDY